MHETGSVSTDFVARSLGLSQRHVRRLLRDLPEPQERTPWNKLPDDVRAYVVEEKQEHPRLNCQWLAELASDRFARSVSRASVWRVLKEAGLLVRTPTAPSVLRHRFEAAACGDLVQMDTTWGYWLHGKPLYLTVLLDDHSRVLLAGRWATQETLWHNMDLIRKTVETHGTFRVLYTDNAVWFKAIRHNQSLYQTHRQTEYESEITRACRDLDIVHVTHKPYEPQGKGKVERFFRFVQERFVSQIIEDPVPLWLVNKKFKAWMRWYNERHVNRTTGLPPKKRFDPNGFKPLSVTERRKLDDVFCIRETRIVDKCNRFSHDSTSYEIPGTRSFARERVDLHIHPHQKIRVWHAGAFICEMPIR